MRGNGWTRQMLADGSGPKVGRHGYDETAARPPAAAPAGQVRWYSQPPAHMIQYTTRCHPAHSGAGMSAPTSTLAEVTAPTPPESTRSSRTGGRVSSRCGSGTRRSKAPARRCSRSRRSSWRAPTSNTVIPSSCSGVPGATVTADNIPDVIWVSAKAGTACALSLRDEALGRPDDDHDRPEEQNVLGGEAADLTD